MDHEDDTATRSLGDDLQFFDEAKPGSLADQRDLIDEDGDDIRQYTGEPVETEDGWVLPVQQNVGPGNEAGQGEYPDRNTAPVQPPVDEPESSPLERDVRGEDVP